MRYLKIVLALLKRTLKNFLNDRCTSMAAAVAYYTVFSLPPLLILIVMMLGVVIDRETLETGIMDQLTRLIGSGGASQVEEILKRGNDVGSNGALPTTLSIAASAFS